jgi:hypothetical protein
MPQFLYSATKSSFSSKRVRTNGSSNNSGSGDSSDETNDSADEQQQHAATDAVNHHEKQQQRSPSALSLRQLSVWDAIRVNLIHYQPLLELLDAAMSRLLWLTPSSSRSSSDGSFRWREIAWGALQLQRLALDLANNTTYNDQRRTNTNTYGASVSCGTKQQSSSSFGADSYATSMRIGLSILQCLGPVLHELVASNSSSSSSEQQQRQQSRVRAMTERLRFVLRCALLVPYWRAILTRKRAAEKSKFVIPGLLLEGGLFLTSSGALTVAQEQKRIEREQYKGRRTGRRVVAKKSTTLASSTNFTTPAVSNNTNNSTTVPSMQMIMVMVGELLYVARPLFQAKAECSSENPSKRFHAWLVSLGMDVASLAVLYPSKARGNIYTQDEWNRRRMRLFLYLLRVPIWDTKTRPGVERFSTAIEKFPLLGGVLSSYLWDWIYYWKLYRLEEG